MNTIWKKQPISVKTGDFSSKLRIFRSSGFGQVDRTFGRTCSVYFRRTFGRTVRVRSYTSIWYLMTILPVNNPSSLGTRDAEKINILALVHKNAIISNFIVSHFISQCKNSEILLTRTRFFRKFVVKLTDLVLKTIVSWFHELRFQ